MDVSFLDMCPVVAGKDAVHSIRSSLAVVRALDNTSCLRYFFAEHHNRRYAHGAPLAMAGAGLAMTSRIRVGSAGVMLKNHAPYVVAEQFLVLAAVYGDRCDLGVGAAPGVDADMASVVSRPLDRFDFVQEVSNLRKFIYEPPGPQPELRSVSELLILGGSHRSAELAGSLGAWFAFAYHLSPTDPATVLEAYRSSFFSRRGQSDPRAFISVDCAVSNSEGDARRKARDSAQFMVGQSEVLGSKVLGETSHAAHKYADRIVHGTVKSVVSQCSDLCSYADADEVLLIVNDVDPASRRAACIALANADTC